MRISSLLLLAAFCLQAQAAVGVRVIFGLADRGETKWDGSATARSGHIASIEPWRFEGTDAVQGTSWTASTHEVRLFGGRGLFGQTVQVPHVANGVVLYLDQETEDTEIDVKTAQGNFTIRLRDIPYGKVTNALNNRVMLDRLPPYHQLTSSPEEQDYPAAVSDKSGNVWLAYMEFHHNRNHDRLRANLKTAPKDFTEYKAPTGGDQIFLMKISGGNAGEPVAITPAGGDLYRPAVAVDGSGRPWVFWSRTIEGNFDVWARAIDNGKPGATVRCESRRRLRRRSLQPLPIPTAASGWRGRAGETARPPFCAAQQTAMHSQRRRWCGESTGNEWNPAIAADNSGRVTMAWDSYRNGNYDIFMRTAGGTSWGTESPAGGDRALRSVSFDRVRRIRAVVGGVRSGRRALGQRFWRLRYQRAVAFIRDVPCGWWIRSRRAHHTTRVPILGACCRACRPARDRTPQNSGRSSASSGLRPIRRTPRRGRGACRAPTSRRRKNTSPRLHIDASGPNLAGSPQRSIRFGGTRWVLCGPSTWSSYDGYAMDWTDFSWRTPTTCSTTGRRWSRGAGELLVIGASDGRRDFHKVQQYATATG